MDRSESPTLAPLAPDPRSGSGADPRRKTRAQATVEFALIAPLLFVLALGIMEFGWLFRSHMTVHFAAREGARTAALAGSQGSNNDAEILRVISTTLTSMSFDDVQEATIYHSDTAGECIIQVSRCQENAYEPGGSGTGWVGIPNRTGNWLPLDRNDIEPTDTVGVRIIYRHRFLVNFLPGANGDVIINDYTIMNIEPRTFPTPTPR